MLKEKVLPFKGAISVLHVKVTDSPSLTVADCGNVANAGLFGSSFGAGKVKNMFKNGNSLIDRFSSKSEYFSIDHFIWLFTEYA